MEGILKKLLNEKYEQSGKNIEKNDGSSEKVHVKAVEQLLDQVV